MSAGSELFVASTIQPMPHSIHIYSIGFLIFRESEQTVPDYEQTDLSRIGFEEISDSVQGGD